MDLIERIGPFLGLVAFLGFAILVLLVIQQAREVRRLRRWAGQAPERALATAETRGEEVPEPERGPVSGRLARWGTAIGARAAAARAWLGRGYKAVDRRSPIDPRVVLGTVLVAALAAGLVLTSGFGLFGEESQVGEGRGGGGGKRGAPPPGRIEVAVLNGTAVSGTAVPGLATEVSELVESAGYGLGEVADTDTGFVETVIMFEPGMRRAARRLARDLRADLGRTPVEPILAEVQDLAAGSDVALVLGQDEAEFGLEDGAVAQ